MTSVPCAPRSRYARNSSIILIGERGVGKQTLASITAKALGWDAIFPDSVFNDLAKSDILSYVRNYGWEDFRIKEAKILASLLSRYPTNKVIVCDGGVVEREENRRLLKSFGNSRGPVIYVMREKNAVLRYLETSAAQYPDYSRATLVERWDLRATFFRDCSSHEFFSLPAPTPSFSSSVPPPRSNSDSKIPSGLALKSVETSFMRLLRFIFGTGTNHIPVEPGSPRSFSLSLAFSDLADAIPLLDDISTGIDCWEVRADCFPPTLDASEIAYQLALLRRQSDLPILFAVRTRSQGGRFPDLMGGAEYPLELQLASQRRLHDLVMLAYRVGCEYVDLELVWPESVLVSLIANRGNTKVIGSWYDRVGRYSWTGREMREIHERGARLGVDFIKIVNTARRSEDNITLRAFVDQTATRGIPLIAINDGTEGKLSRIQNAILAPVSHPELVSDDLFPVQPLSYAESTTTLYLIGRLPAQSYYLFGNPLIPSLSPVLYRGAFSALTIPSSFSTFRATLVDQDLARLREVVNRPDFGGAAVTRPLKIAAMSLCKRVSYEARAIGAVNTLLPISVTTGLIRTPLSNDYVSDTGESNISPSSPSSSRSSSASSSALSSSPRSSFHIIPNHNPHGHVGPGSSVSHPYTSIHTFGHASSPGQGIFGENSDWRAIHVCVSRKITPENTVTSSTTALVIGAGVASRAAIFALHTLGVANIFVWNRTGDRARSIVEELGKRLKESEFPGCGGGSLRLTVLDGSLDAENVRKRISPLPMPTIIISAIPGSVPIMLPDGREDTTRLGDMPDVGLRRGLLNLSPTGGIAVELAYRPRNTMLLSVVEEVNNSPLPSSPSTTYRDTHRRRASATSSVAYAGNSPSPSLRSGGSAVQTRPEVGPSRESQGAHWVAVEGYEVLLEQGYEQIRLWTSRRAPKAKIRAEVLEKYELQAQQGLA